MKPYQKHGRLQQKYKNRPLPGSDEPIVEEKLIKIAFALHQPGPDNETISETLEPDKIVLNNTQ